MMQSARTIYGCPVYINDNLCRGKPNMLPSKEFERLQSPELVEETAKWMADFFGREPDKSIMLTDPYTKQQHIYLSERSYLALKANTSSYKRDYTNHLQTVL